MQISPYHNQKRRWLTAIIGLSLTSAFYYLFREKAILLLTIAIAFLAYREYLQLLLDAENSKTLQTIKIYFSILLASIFILLPTYAYVYIILALIFFLVILLLPRRESEVKLGYYHLKDIFCIAFGIFYIINFLFYLPKIYSMENGGFWLFALLFTVFSSDAFAYYGGKSFGQHKVSAISPKKTWEGCLFHLLASLAILYGLNAYYFEAMSTLPVLLLGVVVSVLAQLGDFFESILKRMVNAKDSGTILPGHGGALDRFDALILISPFYYYYILNYL